MQTIGRRVEQLTKENPTMAVTSEQMAKDLRLMNEAVSSASDLLDGETKQQFREVSSRISKLLRTAPTCSALRSTASNR
jgi:type IV secretion system T-DNA border endonuclease VirD2